MIFLTEYSIIEDKTDYTQTSETGQRRLREPNPRFVMRFTVESNSYNELSDFARNLAKGKE